MFREIAGKLWGRLPPYFRDKSEGVGIAQFQALPPRQQNILVLGSDEEALRVIEELRTQDRPGRQSLFGEAAEEYVYERRSLVQEVRDMIARQQTPVH